MKGLLARISWLLLKQEMVGIDSIGNKYYRKLEKLGDSSIIERRFVKPKADIYNPREIPPEWNSWLHKSRDLVPSDADIAQGNAAREAFKQKVDDVAKQAEMADRRWREQQSSSSSSGGFKPQLGSERE